MPSDPVWIDEGTAASTKSPVDVVQRASPDLTTTTTADPGTSGTTLAVTAFAKFPAVNGFKVRVESEVMLVTAGAGTNSWTVTRAQDGTTGVAHSIGVTVALVVSVQRVEPVDGSKQVSYKGRAATFKTLGRAGTTGQKVFALHNASGSAVVVDVQKIFVDVMQTAARVIEPPVVRLWKFTAVPTNGTAITKVPEDSLQASSSSVTLWQDAASDTTNSATALTVTLPAGTVISQSWGARALTLVGYEQFDREIFFESEDETLTLRALEGVCVFLDYTAAVANPVTDKWIVGVRWTEWTAA